MLKAIAYDANGGVTTSATVSITVTGSTAVPTTVTFHASVDQAIVTTYRLDVYGNGANPSTTLPIASSDLGKGTPDANGDITVNRATFFSGLAPGTYIATVAAVGTGGENKSLPITFTR